ncbi:MAG: hypothetical protein HT580_06530 [Dechloromonas sp.]|nr:MAG: hypothetical protein HT580_06530 [Dechloromonas sp.]
MKRWIQLAGLAIALLGSALSALAASDIVLIDQSNPHTPSMPACRAKKRRCPRQDCQPAGPTGHLQGIFRTPGRTDWCPRGGRRIPQFQSHRRHRRAGQKHPGTPFGITWNGGIAFTRNDYTFAKNQFAAYKKTRKTIDAPGNRISPPTPFIRQTISARCWVGERSMGQARRPCR